MSTNGSWTDECIQLRSKGDACLELAVIELTPVRNIAVAGMPITCACKSLILQPWQSLRHTACWSWTRSLQQTCKGAPCILLLYKSRSQVHCSSSALELPQLHGD